ncbi:MAG TPA: glycosyltransferase [Treponemataceae bacterium]|jgi:colanic acid/amylovoran biosynthesis glycosyltransferase|nr:MAG: GDP-mannose-dependent alpha-(1-6)-phosphatidylinositol monomannoside mannosyltransferase [Spirochaetes bacterium ADurb.Bin215]HPA09387.1 glycosyltransferase [Treponemataceae bacterium]HPX14896.1 glycosyltransferase [Treponemataceae bacterium]
MKIAIILNSFPKISEKFLLNHLIGLVNAGCDIHIFAARKFPQEPYHGIYYDNHMDRYTTWLGIPYKPLPRFLKAPVLFLRLFARNPRAAFEALKFGKYRTVAKNCKLLYFGNAFHGKHFDIVHCHFGPNGLIGTYLKECGYADRVITAFHGSDINSYPKRYGQDVYRILYEKCDLFTANTAYTRGKMVENGCDEQLIRIVPESLIASEYDGVDGSSRIPQSVLTVGRLEEKKGHTYALRAIAKIREFFPDLRYYMVGSGTLDKDLRDQATALGILDICDFVGSCTGEKVKEFYGTCEVFTLPSVTASNGDKEGQGLVIQEAQICGMPVVTTRHNGIPDGLLDGETGYLVEEADVDALADKLKLLLENEQLRRSFGKKGKTFVSSKYDIAVITKTLEVCYNEVLETTAR